MRYFVVIVSFILSVTAHAQTEKEMVLKAIEEAKSLISQKQYSNAQGRLEDMRVFGVCTDSIDYYMKVVDYLVDLDSAEVLYQKKRFKEARAQFNLIYPRYKDVVNSMPIWILRCDTIIQAQKKGNAVTSELSKVVKLFNRPYEGFIDGVTFVWLGGDYYRILKKNGDIVDFTLPGQSMIWKFSEGYAAFEYSEGKVPYIGYVDTKGKIVLKVRYDYGGNYHEGLAVVRKEDKWGYIDKTGNEVIPCQYDYAGDFSEGLALVMVKDKYGFKVLYINRDGKVVIEKIDNKVIPCLYNRNSPNPMNTDFSEGLAFDGTNSFFTLSGVLAFNCVRNYRLDRYVRKYPHPFLCSRSLVAVGKTDKDSKYGFIDKTGNEIIPIEYDDAYDFSEQYAWVCKGNSYGCINTDGKLIIDYQYESVGYTDDGRKRGIYTGFYKFSEGLAGVKKNGKWGFVDYYGNIVIPFEYDEVFNFSEGFAWVKKKGKWGLVDKFGTTTFDY